MGWGDDESIEQKTEMRGRGNCSREGRKCHGITHPYRSLVYEKVLCRKWSFVVEFFAPHKISSGSEKFLLSACHQLIISISPSYPQFSSLSTITSHTSGTSIILPNQNQLQFVHLVEDAEIATVCCLFIFVTHYHLI